MTLTHTTDQPSRWARRHPGIVLASLALGVTAAACGSSRPGSNSATTKTSSASSPTTTSSVACAKGTVSGAGSTFVATIAQQWIKDYETACPGATINYQAVGSGAGFTQFANGTVDFGASDVVLTSSEAQALASKGTVLQIPWAAGGVAVEYHLSGVSRLKLSPSDLAKIFSGRITHWNDPALVAENKGATLPNEPIQTFHRSDSSGTTSVLTSYLAAVDAGDWTFGAGKTWTAPGGQGAKGSSGVTAAVGQTEGGIGYSEVSYARGAGLPMASIKNAAGNYVQPTSANVTAALSDATVPPDLTVQVNYQAGGAQAYPISTTTWVLVLEKPTSTASANLLKDFITYAVTGGQSDANSLFYAPLPNSLAAKDKTAAASIGS
jgi:phosphate transport system substrate-binding protein